MDITARQVSLEELAKTEFKQLNDKERALIKAASRGEPVYCGPNGRKLDAPENDPTKAADTWKEERTIRAELIRWLCINPEASALVNPFGIRIYAAKIAGDVDLSFATTSFPLLIDRSFVVGQINLTAASMPWIELDGSRARVLTAASIHVKGNVSLRNFSTEGGVLLSCAEIDSNLVCSGATFTNPTGAAMSLVSGRIQGSVLLNGSFNASGTVLLYCTQIGGLLDCRGGRFAAPPHPEPGQEKTRDALTCSMCRITGAVLLGKGFSADGTVNFQAAEIDGIFDCGQGRFQNTGGVALTLDAAYVRSAIFLNDKFVAKGAVRLVGAKIGPLVATNGTFDMASDALSGTTLSKARESALNLAGVITNGSISLDGSTLVSPAGYSILAEHSGIRGSVYLRNQFKAKGEVSFLRANIEGSLSCNGGSFDGTQSGGRALLADAAVVGDVDLRDGFCAKGEVSLLGAQIRGDLACDGRFENPGFYAILLERAQIGGALHLQKKLKTDGQVILSDARVGVLADWADTWPESTNSMGLSGFVYGSIDSDSVTEANRRLKWLRLQLPDGEVNGAKKSGVVKGKKESQGDSASESRRGPSAGAFHPQSYRQLAKVLSEQGRERDARRVLIGMERDRYSYGGLGPLAKFQSWCSWAMIGYGYRPIQAVAGIVLLWTIGFFWFGAGYQSGSGFMVQSASEGCRSVPFCAAVYSLDAALPVINLGQKDCWLPIDSKVSFKHDKHIPLYRTLCDADFLAFSSMPSPTGLRVFRWLDIVFGWILGAMFLAGVTGLIRRG